MRWARAWDAAAVCCRSAASSPPSGSEKMEAGKSLLCLDALKVTHFFHRPGIVRDEKRCLNCFCGQAQQKKIFVCVEFRGVERLSLVQTNRGHLHGLWRSPIAIVVSLSRVTDLTKLNATRFAGFAGALVCVLLEKEGGLGGISRVSCQHHRRVRHASHILGSTAGPVCRKTWGRQGVCQLVFAVKRPRQS